jgi:PAS domain S-box-containing protein
VSKPTPQPPSRPAIGRLIPIVIFLVLASITGIVWRQVVKNQRELLKRHTDDVSQQAARRLELFFDFRMAAMRLFARRWSTHEARDFSRTRFEEFARLMLAEFPGYHSVRLVPPDLSPGWLVRHGARRDGESVSPQRRPRREDPNPLTPALTALVVGARTRKQLQLSSPLPAEEAAHLHVSAALPLLRDAAFLGVLLVEIDVAKLIDACFRRRMRAEFGFEVGVGAQVVYRYLAEGQPPPSGGEELFRVTHGFAVHDQGWWLSVLPRADEVRLIGWRATLSIPFLGLALSIGLAWLVAQLSRRMDMYIAARDRAVSENQERARAELALRASESRYRSVFDSATDGLVIFDAEGVIRTANRAAHEMHGYGVDELKGCSFVALVAPERQAVAQELLRLVALNMPARLESLHRRRDGATFDVEVRGTPFRYGDAPRVLAILTDVSDRKRAEQRQALLSRKVLVAQEEERARISRELHDELGQLLTALRFELDWLRKRAARASADAGGSFGNSVELVEKAAAELRRICKGLRPPLLDDLGLDPAARLLVDEFRERTGIAAELELALGEGQRSLAPEIALSTYRVLQESLTNVSRHSQASEVRISLRRQDAVLALLVVDNGRGFDPAHPAHAGGSGLAGMRERANIVDGRLEIRSRPGQGTEVEFHVPVVEAAAAPRGATAGDIKEHT